MVLQCPGARQLRVPMLESGMRRHCGTCVEEMSSSLLDTFHCQYLKGIPMKQVMRQFKYAVRSETDLGYKDVSSSWEFLRC